MPATKRTVGGHLSLGAKPRSYQVTPAIVERRRATRPLIARPTVGAEALGQPAASPTTNRPRRTTPSDPKNNPSDRSLHTVTARATRQQSDVRKRSGRGETGGLPGVVLVATGERRPSHDAGQLRCWHEAWFRNAVRGIGLSDCLSAENPRLWACSALRHVGAGPPPCGGFLFVASAKPLAPARALR